jgi:lipopolysaccharide transport system permease protein
MLGWLDIRQRYRRSFIGPFWITISMGVMVSALGFVYSTLLGSPISELLPYLAGGFIAWALISAMMIEGAAVFTASEPFIKHGNVPLSLHALRLYWRHAITFGHNLAILLGVYIFFQFSPSASILIFPVTFALVSAILIIWATIIGALSARFRDLPPIIGSIVQVVFFITPILYKPEMLADRSFVYQFNPFYYMIEGLRAPLLGEPVSIEIVFALLFIFLVSAVLGLLVFARTRGRIAYWL